MACSPANRSARRPPDGGKHGTTANGNAKAREPTRRTFLCSALAAAGLLTLSHPAPLASPSLTIGNVTALYPVVVARVATPKTPSDIVSALADWPGRVAVGGGRYSMGGQVGLRGGLHLDMRSMNALVWVRPQGLCARVQAGMRWRDLQDVLDPLNLAVKTMQSYANFTIGGSVAVNAHGRDVGAGPVGHSVRALQVVLADGSVVETRREQNETLFRAVIGSYGAMGVITEVELDLSENVRMERTVSEVPLSKYVSHFEDEVLADRRSVLHNADLMAPDFDRPVCVTWRRTSQPPTDPQRLVPRDRSHALEQNALWAMTELPGGDRLRRSVIHPLLAAKPAVVWRNREASLDVAELEPRTRRITTYALQEYFVPKRHFIAFAQKLARALSANSRHVLNVSIRHSPADRVSMLPWAKEAVFAFVIFYKQGTGPSARDAVGAWTRQLIELALRHEGRYYLPYQLHATRSQFERAYPEAEAFRSIKRQFDPGSRFSNELWEKYLPPRPA